MIRMILTVVAVPPTPICPIFHRCPVLCAEIKVMMMRQMHQEEDKNVHKTVVVAAAAAVQKLQSKRISHLDRHDDLELGNHWRVRARGNGEDSYPDGRDRVEPPHQCVHYSRLLAFNE